MAAAVLLALVACGGSADLGPRRSLAAGDITCEQLFNESYQFAVQVDFDIVDSPTPFHFTTNSDGKVQDGVKLQAVISNTDGANVTTYEAIVYDSDSSFLKFEPESGWSLEDTTAGPIPFPYKPMELCDALAPDIDTESLGTGSAEDVRGVSSNRYELSETPTEFFSRQPDFGPASDPAAYINTFNGTLWVSQAGRYPTKFELRGQGTFPPGKQLLTMDVKLEVWDMGGDIKIEEPPLGPQSTQQ